MGEAAGVMLTRERGAPYRPSDWKVQTSKQALCQIALNHISSMTLLRSTKKINSSIIETMLAERLNQ